MGTQPGGESRRDTRRRRIAEDLEDAGFVFSDDEAAVRLLLDEIRHALHPPVHERRVPSMGSIVDPVHHPDHWVELTQLRIIEVPIGDQPLDWARRFADGLSSWVIHRTGRQASWAVFDRPSGSERDLAVLADAFGGSIVQRHPSGAVRVVDAHGVWRWERFDWHRERRVSEWIDVLDTCGEQGDPAVIRAILEFAVHDLGALGIGATLVYCPGDMPKAGIEARLPLPPALDVTRPLSLAPLRHALAQVDGAAIFDSAGLLWQIGVRLVPSPDAERDVEGLRGMRHTSARRYSADDPEATVVVVSEDGPVTVLRNGKVLGTSLRPRGG